MKIDDLIGYVNRVAEESAKSALKESYKRLSRQTVEEARLPISFRSPPSDGVDVAITSIIEIFRGADPRSRRVIASRLNPYAGRRFVGYALWAAILAVRTRSPTLIEQGLIALVIEGANDEWQSSVLTLAMLYNSALKLAMDPKQTFADIARLADPGVIQKEMQGFPLREPRNRSLEAFYILEDTTDEGFVYKQIPWWMNFPQRTR